MKDIEWFDRRLARYYDKHYLKYEEDHWIKWFTNEPSKKWEFEVLGLGLRVTLSCEETGPVKVVEKWDRRKRKKFGAYEVNTYGVKKKPAKKGEKK